MAQAPRSPASRGKTAASSDRRISVRTAAPSPDGDNVAEFSVTDLSFAIKRRLEDGFGHVRLRGEVSGYRGPHSSGHCYFGLKDEKAKIDAVIWRGVFNRLRFKPEEGMEVIVTGKVTSYPGGSKYQIVVEALEPAGAGALMALLEERKRKFAAEGLFDEARKSPLPFLPRRVGIITSPTGAVIRDMLHGFNERFPAHVTVWPVRVQGETSADEVARAVRGFNAMPALGDDCATGQPCRPDVLIVARGGGSLEDLWGFNEEVVVRAVAESTIPVISAVGHETDWTLIDLVADARAPTPTKAAEWAVPKYSELMETGAKLSDRLRIGMRRTVENSRTHLKAAARGLPRLEELLAMPRQRFDALANRLGRALLANSRAHAMALTRVASRLRPAALQERLSRSTEQVQMLDARAARAFTNRIQSWRRQLDGQGKMLKSLSYQSVVQRGYAVIRDSAGAMVRSVSAVQPDMVLRLELSDGHVSARALGTEGDGNRDDSGKGGKSTDGEGPAKRKAKAAAAVPADIRPTKKRPAKNSGQGSLF